MPSSHGMRDALPTHFLRLSNEAHVAVESEQSRRLILPMRQRYPLKLGGRIHLGRIPVYQESPTNPIFFLMPDGFE